jgi:alpha-tubulin suppressor-like RCC1 family protein
MRKSWQCYVIMAGDPFVFPTYLGCYKTLVQNVCSHTNGWDFVDFFEFEPTAKKVQARGPKEHEDLLVLGPCPASPFCQFVLSPSFDACGGRVGTLPGLLRISLESFWQRVHSFIRKSFATMKSILASFIEESKESGVTSGEKGEPEVSSEPTRGHLGDMLLAGCNDWENTTAKAPNGLEGLYRVELGSKVQKGFSSSSAMHSFALLEDGTLSAMGRNDCGQLGTGDTVVRQLPVRITMPVRSAVVKVSTGRSHTLILFANGEVWGCGANNFGQLGLGDSKTMQKNALKFVRVFFGEEVSIRDIACGHDFSLACSMEGAAFSFGHPEYGVLGHGTDGQYIKDGGRGAQIQYSCVHTPRRIEQFLTKDNHGKLTATIPATALVIRAVAAGKNHSVCVEEWEGAEENFNRVFSWGWGGYGRLGHNTSQDELKPREVSFFSHTVPGAQGNHASLRVQVRQALKQKCVREIYAGGSFSLVVTESRNLYFWGKLSNAPRGEATVYPVMSAELYNYPVRQVSAGSNLIVVVAAKPKPFRPASAPAPSGPVEDPGCCVVAW